jgi:hypothetical protein
MTLEMSVALRCVLRIAYCVLSLAMRIVSCVQRAFTSNSVCVVSARSFLMTFLPAGIFRYNVCRRSTLFEALAFLSHDGHPINSGSSSHALRELWFPHPPSSYIDFNMGMNAATTQELRSTGMLYVRRYKLN